MLSLIGRVLNTVSALNGQTSSAFYAGAVDHFRHIAILMNGNTVVSIGTNHMKIGYSHALINKISEHSTFTTVESVHAEADAINRYYAAMKRKNNTHRRAKLTLYVFRVGHNGGLKKSRPCDGCQKKIANCSKINHVISSTNDGFIDENPREYH